MNYEDELERYEDEAEDRYDDYDEDFEDEFFDDEDDLHFCKVGVWHLTMMSSFMYSAVLFFRIIFAFAASLKLKKY